MENNSNKPIKDTMSDVLIFISAGPPNKTEIALPKSYLMICVQSRKKGVRRQQK
jgi:hypothetical protein